MRAYARVCVCVLDYVAFDYSDCIMLVMNEWMSEWMHEYGALV